MAGVGDGEAESRRKEEERERVGVGFWLGPDQRDYKGLVPVSAQSARGHARTGQRGA